VEVIILFLFTQIPTMQAQETLDIAKITCDQFVLEKLATPSRDIVMWLSGYYHGKHNNTIVQPQTLQQNEYKVYSYCSRHRDTTVMDAVESMLASDK
jgi:acid stress chaperone HdeB